MNAWDWALLGLGWLVALIVAVLLALVLFIIVGSIVHAVRRSLPSPKVHDPRVKPKPSIALDDYMAEATVVGLSLYGPSPNPSLEAFRAGARWAWGFFHRP